MNNQFLRHLRVAFVTIITLVGSLSVSAQEKMEPSSQEEIEKGLSGGVPNGRWKEGLLFEGVRPMPWMQSAANWFPGTEEIQPEEIRVTFMGTAPLIRPGQMNTSIFIELGNGENFVFDLGEGSIANYTAARVALNQINHVFITHLHVDHFGALPYLWMFRTWNGGWHEPLTVHGPSGRTSEYGTATMVEGMKMMTGWHRDAFSVFPAGKGWDIQVNEFDFRDNGGVVYEKNGVKITHWQRSHAKDGASAYRLDWNGMSVVWTGDGRPSELDVEYAKGVDLYITELQQEVVEINSGVQGVPPFLARYTIDTHHSPAYGVGYVANLIQPRMLMTTHQDYDPFLNEEVVAEVREHWKGPYRFGAPDGIVVNITKESIWVREGILPDYPNTRAPQFNFDNGQLVVPHPPTSRAEIQEPFVREKQIDPKLYYPIGYHPELLEDWPVDGDLVVPMELLPENLKKNMSAQWELKKRNQKILDEKKKKEE